MGLHPFYYCTFVIAVELFVMEIVYVIVYYFVFVFIVQSLG